MRVSWKTHARLKELCKTTGLSVTKVVDWLIERYGDELTRKHALRMPPTNEQNETRYMTVADTLWVLDPILEALDAIIKTYPDLKAEAALHVQQAFARGMQLAKEAGLLKVDEALTT